MEEMDGAERRQRTEERKKLGENEREYDRRGKFSRVWENLGRERRRWRGQERREGTFLIRKVREEEGRRKNVKMWSGKEREEIREEEEGGEVRDKKKSVGR